ncbi:hypothetical protein GCM10022200_29340 [Microbacterium awajiense]|uniref:Transcription regulator PadR N-terminal domain-containing protein n=1 Tax=Microbacterium awajiense TaxID=415214 RepID=A0ABP7AYF7_9MICO
MNATFGSDPFGTRGSGSGGSGFGGSSASGGQGGWPMSGLWEALDQLREGFEQRFTGGSRMGRGDVRTAVLALLREEPMHGYQIIHEIEERSGGMWKPSPGSVYPTLQMLADEGLISVEESGGKKVYSLTETGRAEADAGADQSAPWETPGMKDAARAGALPKAGVKLAQAAAQVGRTGSKEQIDEAVAVLDEARRKLYAILARE